MSTFELKTQLPYQDQLELDRCLAIPAAKRTASEQAFLDAREPYQYNKVLRYDTSAVATPQNPHPQASTDLILEAEGNTLPTGYSGFKKGAIFRDLDKTGRNVYINVGTSSSAVWGYAGDAVSSPSPSASVSPSSSVSTSVSPSVSASVSPSSSVSPSTSPSSSVSPSASVSPSGSSSLSRSPSASTSPSGSVSPSASTSPTPSASTSPSASHSPSASRSPSSSVSPSVSPSPSFPEV